MPRARAQLPAVAPPGSSVGQGAGRLGPSQRHGAAAAAGGVTDPPSSPTSMAPPAGRSAALLHQRAAQPLSLTSDLAGSMAGVPPGGWIRWRTAGSMVGAPLATGSGGGRPDPWRPCPPAAGSGGGRLDPWRAPPLPWWIHGRRASRQRIQGGLVLRRDQRVRGHPMLGPVG